MSNTTMIIIVVVLALIAAIAVVLRARPLGKLTLRRTIAVNYYGLAQAATGGSIARAAK